MRRSPVDIAGVSDIVARTLRDAHAPPALVKLNARRFIVTSGQNGSKEGSTSRRSYVRGFMERDHAHRFQRRMCELDDVLVFVTEFPRYTPSEATLRHTLDVAVERSHSAPSDVRMPSIVVSPPIFSREWAELPRATGLADDGVAMRRVWPKCAFVLVIDMRWGREQWLFDEVARALYGSLHADPIGREGTGNRKH